MGGLQQCVLDFVAKKTGLPANKISLESRLAEDLGIDGDDAIELFEAFSEQFSVDIGELFQTWNSYFRPEALLAALPLGGTDPIAVQELVEAAVAGKWRKGSNTEQELFRSIR